MKRLIPSLLLLILISCQPITAPVSPLPPPPQSPLAYPVGRGEVHSVYLPYLSNSNVQAASDGCSGSIVEQQLVFLFVTDPGQKRIKPTCDAHLMQAARHRAEDMATRQYFSHLDVDGISPNEWATRFGCTLPDWYLPVGNQIESIGLNYPSAFDAWEGWKASPAHRAHVLGEVDFWAEQTSYGVGYAESAWGKVWVILTTPGCV